MLSALSGICIAVSAFLFVTGIMRFIQCIPMLNTYKKRGVLRDARVTKDNVLGEEFSSPRTYIYFTYEVDGIAHGSTKVSEINDSSSRNLIREVSEKFTKNNQFEIDVFVNKKDARKAYLLGEGNIKMTRLLLGLLFAFVAIAAHLLG